jgi:hypothetical protein
MIMRMLRLGLPVVGLELAGVAGAAYLTWEHDQGRHEQANLLCPICWMDKLVPVAEASAGTSVATSPEPTAPEPTAESAPA